MLAVRRFAVCSALLLFVSLGAVGDPPRLAVRGDGVVVQGLAPGGRVAWMAFTRERIQWHSKASIRYGFGVAGADGALHVPHPVPTAPYVVWNVADVTRGSGVHATPARMDVAAAKTTVSATAGEQSIIVDAAQVHLLYVSPPSGAWSTTAADGGGGDADGQNDGHITIRLSTLRAIEGNRKPPEGVGRGDVIMVVDPHQLRVGQVAIP